MRGAETMAQPPVQAHGSPRALRERCSVSASSGWGPCPFRVIPGTVTFNAADDTRRHLAPEHTP